MICHTEIIQSLDTYQLGAVSGEEVRLQRDFKIKPTAWNFVNQLPQHECVAAIGHFDSECFDSE